MTLTSKPTTQAVGLNVIPRAAGAALQWRLLLLWSACLLVPTAVLALPVWQMLGGALDHSVHATALARQLDAFTVADLSAVIGRNGAMLNTAGLLALLVTLLLSPLLSGFVLIAARVRLQTHGAACAGFGQLMTGALAAYGRMLRLLLWSVVPLGIALAAGGQVMDFATRHNATALTETDAHLASRLALVVALLLFGLAHATVDAGRAMLALEPQRTSAVKAWWRGLRLLVRRPLATLGSYLVLGLVGLAVAGALGVARINLAPLGATMAVLGFLVTQLAALVLAWMRSARLFALIDVAASRVERVAVPATLSAQAGEESAVSLP